MTKEYIGDGAFAEFDGFGVMISAPRGMDEHWVYLEPKVIIALLRKLAKHYDPAQLASAVLPGAGE